MLITVRLIYFMVVFVLLSSGNVWSQKRNQFEQFDEKNYFGFHFDDDFLFIFNRDEQYTGGLEFEYMHAASTVKSHRGVLNPFFNSKRFWTCSLGSQLYTPNNITDSLIILNDRPFSSYLYATIGYIAYDEGSERKLTVDLNLGMMGSELPGKVQDFIHQFGESPSANGWKNKLADKEVFIPNLRINYQKNLITCGRIPFLMLNWIQIGTVAELNTGLYLNAVRAGLKISGFNHTPLTASKIKFETKNNVGNQQSKWRITTYFMPQIQLVGYNTSLQSLPWLNSPYVITPDLVNRHVWVIEAGINLSHKRFHLSYVVQARSKEFRKFQPDWHSWGGVTMGFSF